MLKLRKLMAAALSVIGLQACIFGVQPLTNSNTVTAVGYSEMIPFIKEENCYYKMVDENDDGIYDYAEICETHTINNTEIIVPSEVNGLPVLSIGERAFYDPFSYLEKLKSVKIESGVVSIGENAFYDSYHLESVDLPDTITYIGDNAFKNCNNLKSIRIPNGLTAINAGTFSTCVGLSSVTIPKNVNNIGAEAFANCGNLKSITIENPDCKIYDSRDTIYSNIIPGSNNNEKIFEGVIYGYKGSTAQAYAEKYNCKFKAIDEQPPMTTSPVETTTVKPETTVTTVVTTVNTDLPVTTAPAVSDVIYPASMLRPVSTTIKNSVNYEYSYTKIGKKQGVKIDACSGEVKELEIPDEINGKPVIALGSSAFSACPGVESIIISENVEKIIIGTGSFVCPNLKNITVSENNENYSSEDGILFNKDKSALIKFPAASPLTTFKIPESVSEICFEAFGGCANLTDVIIPENVGFIKDCAFKSCKNLKNITIKNPGCRIADPSVTICNESEEGRKDYNGVIYGYDGSIAQKYAKNCGYKFENIGEYTMRVADVVRLKKMIVSGYMEYSEIYDINNDGVVNVFDVIALRRSLLNP